MDDPTRAMPKTTEEPTATLKVDETQPLRLPPRSALVRGHVTEPRTRPTGTVYRGRTADQQPRERMRPVRSRRSRAQEVRETLWLARICTTLVIGLWAFVIVLVIYR